MKKKNLRIYSSRSSTKEVNTLDEVGFNYHHRRSALCDVRSYTDHDWIQRAIRYLGNNLGGGIFDFDSSLGNLGCCGDMESAQSQGFRWINRIYNQAATSINRGTARLRRLENLSTSGCNTRLFSSSSLYHPYDSFQGLCYENYEHQFSYMVPQSSQRSRCQVVSRTLSMECIFSDWLLREKNRNDAKNRIESGRVFGNYSELLYWWKKIESIIWLIWHRIQHPNRLRDKTYCGTINSIWSRVPMGISLLYLLKKEIRQKVY